MSKTSPPETDDERVSPHVSLMHERLVGRVVISWAKLEATLHDLIWQFYGLDTNDGRILTKRQDAKHLVLMIRSISEQHFEPKLHKAFCNLLNRIDQLYGDRNFIVHGTWGTIDHTPFAASLRLKAEKDEFITEPFPQERMMTIYRSIELAKKTLIDLSGRLPALRGKQSSQPQTT
jgi:hypothetical protein